MELTGPIEGLRALTGRRTVAIHSDSAYVVNCFRDKWYLRWRANGWRNAQKKPVENRDLWEAFWSWSSGTMSRGTRWPATAAIL